MSKVGSAEFTIAAHNRTQRGLAEAERGLKGIAANAKAMFAVFSSGYAASKVFSLVGDGIKMMGDAADQAANLGMMGSSLILLGRAAAEGGAGMEEVVTVLRKVDENTAAALAGNDAMAESFRRLGLSATVLRGVAPEKALEMLAKAYQRAGNDAEAFDALLNITGARTAPKLLDMLRRLGTEGLDGLSAKFGTVSESSVKAVDQVADAYGKLLEDLKLGTAGLMVDAANFYAGPDVAGRADSLANGQAAQQDINRRMKAQNDAARLEMESTRAKKDLEHKLFMDGMAKYEKEKALIEKQIAAQEVMMGMSDRRLAAEWDLLAAQAEAPAARSMNTMSGADLNSFVQQQSFQANEDRRKAEHDRRVERLQNELLAVTKEMRDFAKKNEIKEWD